MTDSYIPVTELFKQFCKERHTEDKGKNYDKLQEIYANTELFDLSFLPYDEGGVFFHSISGNKLTMHASWLKGISLPFESQFITVFDEQKGAEQPDMSIKYGFTVGKDNLNIDSTECVFFREFSPFIITGTVWFTFNDYASLNAPFTIWTETGKLVLDIKGWLSYEEFRADDDNERDEELEELERKCFYSRPIHVIRKALNTICNLPKHSVACDRTTKCEYYRRHRASTIKVNKPIYYILDKQEEQVKRAYNRIKPIGSVTFDHSFKVRGHWRRIDHNTLGKNRNNEYVCRGITWVKEHVRGEGELLKKVRVVK